VSRYELEKSADTQRHIGMQSIEVICNPEFLKGHSEANKQEFGMELVDTPNNGIVLWPLFLEVPVMGCDRQARVHPAESGSGRCCNTFIPT